MNLKINFKKILTGLFSISVLLLLSHLILSLLHPGTPSPQIIQISDEEINNKFIECLHSFDVKDQWIKKVKRNSIVPSYIISLPPDLPVAQIIFNLMNEVTGNDIEVTANEKKMGGKTLMKVTSNDEIKLEAEFNYDDKLERAKSKLILFIFGREQKESEYDSLFRNSPKRFSSLLVPSKSASASSKWLRENGFDYAVMLNNSINELDYRIEKDHSEERIKMVVKNIVAAIPNDLFFVIDKNHNIYSSSNYLFLKKEFDKRKIKFITTDSLKFIDNNQQNISDTLNSIVKDVREKDVTRIAISFDAYQSLTDDFKKLIRVGYKFVQTSELKKGEKKK